MKVYCLYLPALLFIVGCSSSLPYRYDCEGNQVVEARIDEDTAIVRFEGKDYAIPRIRSASGVQYETQDRNIGLYTKGNEAMFVLGQTKLRDCKIISE